MLLILYEADNYEEAKKYLGYFKDPSKIHFLYELPKRSSGKIQKFKIKDQIYK